MDLRTRIEQDGITAEVSGLRDAPAWAEGWPHGTNWYDVTLKMGRRRMTVPFGMGPAHTIEPDAADVLNCLTSDASGYENAQDFADWCAEYGFDGEEVAEQIWRTTGRLTKALRRFLGDKYAAYLWDTERL